MAWEIERKFRVSGPWKDLAVRSYRIRQGYLTPEGAGWSVRVRMRDDEAFLTIKGPSPDGGLSRYEFERPIPTDDALCMLAQCVTGPLEKRRWIVPWEGTTYEVDEFEGANAGLVVAEVELPGPDAPFARAPFLGEEVTGDARYYNTSLCAHPFSSW